MLDSTEDLPNTSRISERLEGLAVDAQVEAR
jgi:hypothetical protein